MGEAARRKDLVNEVRKKIGAAAADAVMGLHHEHEALARMYTEQVKRIERLEREVNLLKALMRGSLADEESAPGAGFPRVID